MKTTSMLLASLAALALGASHRAAADLTVSVFYDALEPHGEWIEASDYGYVWTPRGVDAEWRPYTDGTWVYTDAGWTWMSEEPYGWAVYHYGRWVNLVEVGWSWVPDTEWGPAWVSWRNSDRYVGWAPLPPESRETIRVGVNLGNWVDTYYDIGPTNYSFVEIRNLGAPRLRTVLLPPRENITIIHQTTNITNVTVRNNIVVNEGPDYNVIVRQSAQPIRRLKLERQTDIADARAFQGDRYRTRIQGESLSIPAPRIQAAAAGAAAPKKVARKVQVAAVNRGWKDAGDAQKVESFRAKLQAEAKPPANLPPVQRRDRAEGAAAGGDRPTARTGADADPSTRPPAPGRDGRTPREATRPPVGTAGTPSEDPTKPTADTTRPPSDPSKPSAETRNPRSTRPGAATRAPADAAQPADNTSRPGTDSSRPPAGAPGATRPAAATPDPARPGRAGQAEREGKRRPGDRAAEATEGALPKRDPADPGNRRQGEDRSSPPASASPGAGERPQAPDRPDPAGRPGAPDQPGARGERPAKPDLSSPGVDRPGAADRPDARPAKPDGADRRPGADRLDSPARPGGRPEGAGPGDARADRPPGARPPGGDGREGNPAPGNDRPNRQGERATPAGPGGVPGPAAAQGAGASGQGKGDADKPGKEKKAGE